MPDWQPVVVPPLCPRCGAYWECEHQGLPQGGDIRVVTGAPTAGFLPDLAMTQIAEERERKFISPVVPEMVEAAWERIFELQDWGRNAP